MLNDNEKGVKVTRNCAILTPMPEVRVPVRITSYCVFYTPKTICGIIGIFYTPNVIILIPEVLNIFLKMRHTTWCI